MTSLKKIDAREILDSRGNPTIEVELSLENGTIGRSAVPSGASTGKHEAVELRDKDESRYNGKGVLNAVAQIEGEIAKHLINKEYDQESLDLDLIKLDGTDNKSRLGANAILGVSLAFAQALAKNNNQELFEIINQSDVYRRSIKKPWPNMDLPMPMFNILNGGRHASGSTDIQEFMIVPIGAPSFREALRWSGEIYQNLKKILQAKNLETTVGDEGGFAPILRQNTEALDLIMSAINQAGYLPGQQIALALDVAANEFKNQDCYHLKTESRILTREELINWYQDLINQYPIISLEDGLEEDDWEGWQKLTKEFGDKINIVGDDLFVTNANRLQMGIDQQVANAIIIKPNQIGTLTETLAVVKLAQSANYQIVVSHRSGETTDTTITDLAVGVKADFIKAGAPARSERLAKYNRLLEIEEKLEK